jgi:hypothetical protein
MLFIAQLAVCIALLGYFGQRQAYLRRRNRQTWGSLTAQLQRYSAESKNPWTRLQNARVVMEMADYAERNGDSNLEIIAPMQLAALRRSAIEMRLASLKALLGFVQPQPAN